MNTYIEQLRENIELLRLNKNVKVNHFSFQPGINIDVINRMEQRLALHIPEDVKSLFSSFNRLQADWQFSKGQQVFNGYINFPDFETSLGIVSSSGNMYVDDNFFEEVLWTQYFNEIEIAERKKFKLLEALDGVDGNFCYKLSDELPTKLFFLSKHSLADTGKTVAEYIDFVIRTIGMQNLRACFVDKVNIEECLSGKPESKILSDLLMN